MFLPGGETVHMAAVMIFCVGFYCVLLLVLSPRRHRGTRPAALLVVLLGAAGAGQAQQPSAANADELQQLREMVRQLSDRVARLEAERQQTGSGQGTSLDAPHTVADTQALPAASGVLQTQPGGALSAEDRSILDYLKGTTINVVVDGYYAYNFNSPIGRVNLLRAYDVSSNAFSLNQAALVFERAPDVQAGRRFGARLDLQYGQATSTLQGNPANEPRPDIYRNIFQAYGTYIVPVAKGWTIDFGKWGSSLGIEGNYSKDQINYSRSFYFNYLPFYHEGLRTSLKLNDKLALNWWSVNGTNQTEPTNGFKDELFGFTATPTGNVSWVVNYYVGQEHPDATPVTTGCGPVPVQPGLCFQKISPAPNGKIHIFDSYVTWHARPKLTLALEGDYVIQRLWRNAAPGHSSSPSHLAGGAAYARYQFNPKTALGARAEYLSDRGGLFSGVTEALKETTLTYDYTLAEGLMMRTEWRRDFSNQPIFLTSDQGVFKKEQNTATMGVIWWFGRKQGVW